MELEREQARIRGNNNKELQHIIGMPPGVVPGGVNYPGNDNKELQHRLPGGGPASLYIAETATKNYDGTLLHVIAQRLLLKPAIRNYTELQSIVGVYAGNPSYVEETRNYGLVLTPFCVEEVVIKTTRDVSRL